jgi:hypothetical protein
MSDIVNRLRDPTPRWTDIMDDAANEIERLRHDLTIARLDRDHAQRLVNDARGERDEAVAALALYRMEHGCTRGQRTTQWCGEATRLRQVLKDIAKGVANGPRCHAIARAALGETDRLNDCGGSDSCCQGPCKARY